MADKQLIIVVEGTSAMAPYWTTIVSDYLDKIIRSFCADDMIGQNFSSPVASGSTFELALVMFNAHGPYSTFLIQRSGWTRDVNQFFGWLSTLSFSSGESNDVATAEGLAEALMMFALPQNGYHGQQNLDGKRHCILVSASNPCLFPTPVYRPTIGIMEQSEINEVQTENLLYVAETVSTWFGQCSVSLSVICPKQLPKLKAIYNVAKPNQRISEPAVDIKLPHFLVLISNGFSEACAALSRSCMSPMNSSNAIEPPISTWNVAQGTVKVEPGMPQLVLGVQSFGLNNSASYIPQQALNGPLASMGNVARATVKMEPDVASFVGSGHANPLAPTLGMPQQAQGMQYVGLNNSESNMVVPKQASKYFKIWEGSLCGRRLEEPKLITKLEGYSINEPLETLAANWPSTMYIVRLISLDHMHNKQSVDTADLLVFRVMHQHGFFSQLQLRKLCAVVELPSQTLLLCVSSKPGCLLAMLFPVDMVDFKQQIPIQHDQEQQSQQQQHQQQHQLQRFLQQQYPQLQQHELHMLQQLTRQRQLQYRPLRFQQQQISQPQQIVGDGMGQDHIAKNGFIGTSEPL